MVELGPGKADGSEFSNAQIELGQTVLMIAMPAEQVISDRFGLEAPTLQSHLGRSAITFSRLSCDEFGHGRSKNADPEDAFSLHVQLRETESYELYFRDRRVAYGHARAGAIFLSALENEPAAVLNSPFDFCRIHIPRAAIDHLAPDAVGLRMPDHGHVDPLMLRIIASFLPLFGQPAGAGQLFLDSVATTLLDYLLLSYSGEPLIFHQLKGGLAPWQERRAKDFIEANALAGLTLAEIAGECGLSPGHFAKAFRVSTGKPPHRWLLECRVELAKQALVDSGIPLAEIARRTGFSDASHFSRIFSQVAGEGPAAWRRRHKARRRSSGDERWPLESPKNADF